MTKFRSFLVLGGGLPNKIPLRAPIWPGAALGTSEDKSVCLAGTSSRPIMCQPLCLYWDDLCKKNNNNEKGTIACVAVQSSSHDLSDTLSAG